LKDGLGTLLIVIGVSMVAGESFPDEKYTVLELEKQFASVHFLIYLGLLVVAVNLLLAAAASLQSNEAEEGRELFSFCGSDNEKVCFGTGMGFFFIVDHGGPA
jgi:hypothetical protein